MHKRTRRTLWIVAAVLLVLAAALYLRFKAPPEAARLLPESDGIVYVNVKPLRWLLRKNLKPVMHAPEYQTFLDATGIDPERDLDEAAIALHRMSDPRGPNGPVAYSMVLMGKLDGKRLTGYLEAHAASKEVYEERTIYSLPSEGRSVRVVLISYDTVAVSNTPSQEQIHSMLDRHRTAALPFSGSTLLEERYSEIPLLSVVWGMGAIGLPFSESGNVQIFGMTLPIPADTTFLASVHWSGPFNPVKMRLVEIAPSEGDAVSQTASLNTLLSLARGATVGLAGTPANNSLKEVLRTAEISQRRDRVTVNANLPADLPTELLNSGAAGSPGSPTGSK